MTDFILPANHFTELCLVSLKSLTYADVMWYFLGSNRILFNGISLYLITLFQPQNHTLSSSCFGEENNDAYYLDFQRTIPSFGKCLFSVCKLIIKGTSLTATEINVICVATVHWLFIADCVHLFCENDYFLC